MDQTTILVLIAAALVGLVATVLIMRRQRKANEPDRESPFAVSTEGEKICPRCGMGNLWTDRSCISCGASLKS